MSRFAIRTPYLIIVSCLIILVLGVSSIARMPVDMFPTMNVPVVIVATFYSGMPPEQVEGNITYHLERFFTLASGIDHIESRSLNGVSIIRIYFQPDTNADTDAATIANLAVSDMKDLPPGTFPPVVLKSDASSLPVCLVTMNGDGMTDLLQYDPSGGGAILNISSLNSEVPMFGGSAYCTAKAGVAMLTKCGALELAESHIRVNAVSPGLTDTPLTSMTKTVPGILDAYNERIPFKRAASPEEIAAAALYLSSDDATYISGVNLFVDGAWATTGYPDLRPHIAAAMAAASAENGAQG